MSWKVILNLRKFVIAIRREPKIWNKLLAATKFEREEAWVRIARQFEPGFDSLEGKQKHIAIVTFKRKWKSLKDCYSRERLKQQREHIDGADVNRRPYRYYPLLSFLEKCYTSRAEVPEGTGTSSSHNEDMSENTNTSRTQPEIVESTSTLNNEDMTENNNIEFKNLAKEETEIMKTELLSEDEMDDKEDCDEDIPQLAAPVLPTPDPATPESNKPTGRNSVESQNSGLGILREQIEDDTIDFGTVHCLELSPENITTTICPSSSLQEAEENVGNNRPVAADCRPTAADRRPTANINKERNSLKTTEVPVDISNKLLDLAVKSIEMSQDEDWNFLMSLRGSLKSIHFHRKLHVRREIERIIMEELDSLDHIPMGPVYSYANGIPSGLHQVNCMYHHSSGRSGVPPSHRSMYS